MDSERNKFYSGWPYFPRESTTAPVLLTKCPQCGLTMQTDVTVRGDGLLVCPKCYHSFEPPEGA